MREWLRNVREKAGLLNFRAKFVSANLSVSKIFMHRNSQARQGNTGSACGHLTPPAGRGASATDCSESSDLLDEDGHLLLLDGARAVLVELLEACIEVLLGELTAVAHLREGVLDESLSLVLVECARAVLVVLSPDVVNTLANNCVNVCHFTFSF